MNADEEIKPGAWGNEKGIYCNWLDVKTGERGQGFFNMDTLCELGYGSIHISELVVYVDSVRMPVVEI